MAFRDLEEQILQLKRKQGELQTGLTSLQSVPPVRGTTAERDAAYGIPATDAERVALANRTVEWFNTESGWTESFYMNTGAAGLTVRGIWAGVAPGWYPTGPGPFCAVSPTAAKSVSGAGFMGGWAGNVNRRGGAEWFNTTDTVIQPQKAGVYDIGFFTVLQNGTGSANFHLKILNQPGTNFDRTVDGGAVALQSSLASQINMRLDAFPLTAGQQIAPYVWSGSLQVHYLGTERGRLYARYIAPPLEWS